MNIKKIPNVVVFSMLFVSSSIYASHSVDDVLTETVQCSSTGDQKTLVISVDFPEATNITPSLNKIQSAYFGASNSLADYIVEASYSQAQLSLNDIAGPYVLPLTGEDACDTTKITQQALNIAAKDVDLLNYNRVLIQQSNPPQCDGRSNASIGCGVHITPDGRLIASISRNKTTGLATVFHEAGHNIGLAHASSENYVADAVSAIGIEMNHIEYGDMFDVMGGNVSFVPVHMNAAYKYSMGYVDESDIQFVTNSGSYLVEPLSISKSGNKKAIRIFRGAFVQNNYNGPVYEKEYFWVETRSRDGYDNNLDSKESSAASAFGGLLIRLDRSNKPNSSSVERKTVLIDTHPNTDTGIRDNLDAPLLLNETFTDPYSGISITHSGIDANGDVTVQVNFDTARLDIDEDGLSDQFEISIGLNPSSADSDGDGASDYREVCNDGDCTTYKPTEGDLNALNIDSDGDGMTDGYELTYPSFFGIQGLDPKINDAENDNDSDGLSNIVEFQNGTNPKRADTDFDGLRDWDELNLYQTNPNNKDTDGDGLPDDWEIENGFDPLTNDASSDSDGDGLTEFEEYIRMTDPGEPDTDGDGFTDGEEVNVTGTFANDEDSDDDGLNDYVELQTYSTDPHNADTDGDSYSDFIEVDRGSNPNDINSLPLVIDGDLNEDGQVDIRDLLIMQKVILNMQVANQNQLVKGDLFPPTNRDHVLSISDLLLLQKIILGELD
ncbi:MAG: hypothetical protein QM500_03235 [Methylococcales bacterium]